MKAWAYRYKLALRDADFWFVMYIFHCLPLGCWTLCVWALHPCIRLVLYRGGRAPRGAPGCASGYQICPERLCKSSIRGVNGGDGTASHLRALSECQPAGGRRCASHPIYSSRCVQYSVLIFFFYQYEVQTPGPCHSRRA